VKGGSVGDQPAFLADGGIDIGPEDFELPSWIPSLRDSVWGLAITKITFMVWLTVAVLIVFFLVAYRNPKIVPTRTQWMAESLYGFIRGSVAKEVIGHEGVRFAPYLTTLFLFILLNNFYAILPGFQISPNSHIAFPILLAFISWVMFIYLGIRRHGFVKYFKDALFMPGIPPLMYILVTPLEFASTFLIRPVTLSVRLFANMFAGHLILSVFMLGGAALLASQNFALKGVSLVAFLFAIVLTFFELMVIVLQAYVFTMLTAAYVEGALTEEH
jgi:F-type H+-transporting ATPase subunit a